MKRTEKEKEKEEKEPLGIGEEDVNMLLPEEQNLDLGGVIPGLSRHEHHRLLHKRIHLHPTGSQERSRVPAEGVTHLQHAGDVAITKDIHFSPKKSKKKEEEDSGLQNQEKKKKKEKKTQKRLKQQKRIRWRHRVPPCQSQIMSISIFMVSMATWRNDVIVCC